MEHRQSQRRPRDLCLLYTSDAADERSGVDLGGRRIIRKKSDLLREVAVRDGRGDLRDVADLVREVSGEEVHVVGEVLPRTGHALDLGLCAELPFDADLLRDARDLGRERCLLYTSDAA